MSVVPIAGHSLVDGDGLIRAGIRHREAVGGKVWGGGSPAAGHDQVEAIVPREIGHNCGWGRDRSMDQRGPLPIGADLNAYWQVNVSPLALWDSGPSSTTVSPTARV